MFILKYFEVIQTRISAEADALACVACIERLKLDAKAMEEEATVVMAVCDRDLCLFSLYGMH